jgi:hypothetical protein
MTPPRRRGAARRALVAWALGAGVGGCVSTSLEPGAADPSNPSASSIPITAPRATLRPDFDPDPPGPEAAPPGGHAHQDAHDAGAKP